MGEIVTSDFINLPCVLNINQLENILLETFDVAFTLCNANYAKYGPDKVSKKKLYNAKFNKSKLLFCNKRKKASNNSNVRARF